MNGVAPNTRVTTLGETWDQSYASDSVLYVHSFENYAYYDMFREDLIQYLMPYMEENYSIKTGRENTAVAGFSMGGRESLYIGVSKPELFGYIGAFCPAFGIFEYINADVGAREPGLFTEETFTLPESLKYNTYIQIVKGISDGVVKDQPTIHHNVLEDNGVPHIYYEKSGGHDEGVWGHGYYNFISNAFK